MKPGDIVSSNQVSIPNTATVLEVDGDVAAVWWACPDTVQEDGTIWKGYGRHTKIVPVSWLTVIDTKGSAERHARRPKRTRDLTSDFQSLLPSLRDSA